MGCLQNIFLYLITLFISSGKRVVPYHRHLKSFIQRYQVHPPFVPFYLVIVLGIFKCTKKFIKFYYY